MNEDAFGFYRHALLVGEVTDGECLDSFGALDVSLSAQLPTKGGPAPVTQGEGAGVRGPARAVRRRAQHVVEDQSGHPAMDMFGRTLVWCAQHEL